MGRGPVTPGLSYEDLLEGRDYRSALAIVDECSRATTLTGFEQRALDGIARELGHRNLTFFAGTDLAGAFHDRTPTTIGRATAMAEAYLDRYWLDDAFSAPPAQALHRDRSALRLDDVPVIDERRHDRFYRRFLVANGIRDELVIKLDADGLGYGLIGVLSERERAFDVRELARAELVGRSLGGILRHYLTPALRGRPEATLSAREGEVAALVAQGLSNRQIAERLCIGVDTVKKHMTRALAAMGCRNRTELAIVWGERPPDA